MNLIFISITPAINTINFRFIIARRAKILLKYLLSYEDGNRFTVTLQSANTNAKVELLNGQQQVIAVKNYKGISRVFETPTIQGIYCIRVTTGNEVLSQLLFVQF